MSVTNGHDAQEKLELCPEVVEKKWGQRGLPQGFQPFQETATYSWT